MRTLVAPSALVFALLAASRLAAQPDPAPRVAPVADKYPKDRDYAKETRDLILSRRVNAAYKPGQNVTDLWQTLTIVASGRAAVFDFGVQRAPSLVQWSKKLHTDESEADAWSDACLALEGKHDVAPVLEEIRAICRTIDDLPQASLLDAAKKDHVILPPVESIRPLLNARRYMVGECRAMARMNKLRMLLALHDGDAPAFLQVAEETLLVADILEYDPSIIPRLTAHGVRGLLCSIVRDAVAAGSLTPEMRTGMIRLLTEPEKETWYHTARGERLAVLDALDLAFADRDAFARMIGKEDDQLFLNLAAAKMEPREASLAHAELIHDLFEQAGSRKPAEAREALRKLVELNDRLWDANQDRARFPYIALASPLLHRVLNSEHLGRVWRQGAAALLAIEAYRDIYGKLPESLADLVPQFLPAIPKDAFTFEQDALRYRRVDAATDPSGRSFLLYSVGADREHHDGKEDPDNPDRGISVLKSDAGVDLILNAPPRRPKGNR